MSESKQNLKLPDHIDEYQSRTRHIVDIEREYYLKNRRKANNLPPPTDDNLAGLCISGGGIRSATLGLGMLQALIKARKMRFFDYLSTVSGGGYIGSCLTSLLSDEPRWVDKQNQIKNENKRFEGAMTGLDPENSPFTGLNKGYEYETLPQARLSVKYQLAHLRRHGEYLTPNKHIFGWDVRRAIGALFTGVTLHVMMFVMLVGVVVLLHHALLAFISSGQFIPVLREPHAWLNAEIANPAQHYPAVDQISPEAWSRYAITDKLGAWIERKVYPQYMLMFNALPHHWDVAIGFFGVGMLVGLFFLIYSRRIPYRIAFREAEEQRCASGADGKAVGVFYPRYNGQDMERELTEKFRKRFTRTAYWLGPALAYVITALLHSFGQIEGYHYFVVMALPFFFSLGMYLMIVGVTVFLFYNQVRERVAGRLYRSLYHGMQGAMTISLLLTVAFPLGIVLLFGGHSMAVNLMVSFVPVAAAYYVTLSSVSNRGEGGNSVIKTIAQKLQNPLLNLSIFLFTGMTFAWVSKWLFFLESRLVAEYAISLQPVTLGLLGLLSILLILAGFSINANDISLHHFYRDRLTETYLRTDGRVVQPADDPASKERKDLLDVNFRNHDRLRLADVGEGNGRGPYHILVGALNLQGSHDLAKKAHKSDHFIFSKYFVGSRTTGYYRTDRYWNGITKLSHAMAVSAGAVSSGMGAIGFAASNFYMTLLNLRTGFWMENPLFLHREQQIAAARATGKKIRRTLHQIWAAQFPNRPFWLGYLVGEFTGDLDAEKRRIYVSDGGHTGDNLGLLPLIQRRCRTIVIGDFEEDAKFSFSSFNQAIRLAKGIYDVDIEINLQPLIPKKGEDGHFYSAQSVAKGIIRYDENTVGQIIYMKSSVNPVGGEDDQTIPVYIANYRKSNTSFPHDTTADAYFDEIQFEAYRQLGEFIGQKAATLIQFPEEK